MESVLQIVDSGNRRRLPCHDEQVFKRAELSYRLAFLENLRVVESGARERVVVVETAVYAEVSASVAQVERDVHADGFSESFLRVFLRQARHFLEMRHGSRRDERHEVVDVEALLRERPHHVGVCLRGNFLGCLVPTYFL